jgi:mono/diheme cytochrome c family protein
LPEAKYRIPLPPRYGPPLGNVPDVDRSDKVAYGEYLAKTGHCIECHTPMVCGRRAFSRTGLGGQVFHGPWGESIAANITHDMETGLGKWSDAQIKRAIATGVRADGSKLRPPMAYRYYKNISDDDLNALVAYLRSLKPFNNAKR